MEVKMTDFNILKKWYFISYLVLYHGIPLFFYKNIDFSKKI
jgi:hypothetical protein